MRSRADLPLHRSPLAMAAALGLAAVLLIAFTAVVRQSVAQGDAQRAERSARADAGWRCGNAKGAAARASCLGAFESTRLAGRGVAP